MHRPTCINGKHNEEGVENKIKKNKKSGARRNLREKDDTDAREFTKFLCESDSLLAKINVSDWNLSERSCMLTLTIEEWIARDEQRLGRKSELNVERIDRRAVI